MIGLIAAASASAAAGLLLGAPKPGRIQPRARPVVRFAATVGLIAAGAVSFVLLDGMHVALALVVLAVAAALSREVTRRRRAADADLRSDCVLAACEALASDLRAGQPPATALRAAVEDWPELAAVATAAGLGADVPAALRDLAARPGAGQVRLVAAAWQVAHRSGAGLAGALSMAAGRLRDDRATARVVETELAAAQATARLLALLPIAVLVLGSGLGGDPFGFLLATPVGLVCLSTGLLLEYAGLVWLARIADGVLGRR